jgi:hypothetical protein
MLDLQGEKASLDFHRSTGNTFAIHFRGLDGQDVLEVRGLSQEQLAALMDCITRTLLHDLRSASNRADLLYQQLQQVSGPTMAPAA